jgi:pimeloyl-ACP methyl ester carboxylesterase
LIAEDFIENKYIFLLLFFFTSFAHAEEAPVEKYKSLTCAQAGIDLSQIHRDQKAENYDPNDYTNWFTSPQPQGVVLMVHGVGMRASEMNPLMGPVVENGYDVLRLTLSGHGGSKTDVKPTHEKWLNQLFEGYCLALARAEALNVPLHFVGYSLGPLVNMDLMNRGYLQPIQYRNMAYLAPALTLRPKVESLKHIWRLGFLFMSQRRVRIFRALLNVYEQLQIPVPNPTPTIVFIDKKDELISYKKLHGLISQSPEWREVLVSNENHEEKKEHHYIIYPPALGQEQWQSMVRDLILFLGDSGA